MSLQDHQLFYRRNLPHFQPESATLFVTMRLQGTIPKRVLLDWHEAWQLKKSEISKVDDETLLPARLYDEWKRQFGKMDRYLDYAHYGPTWLKTPEIADLVANAFHHFDDIRYRLDAFSILSNHAHVVLSPLTKADGTPFALKSIMHSIKSFTAGKANAILNRSGETFWQGESYDHVVRDAAGWRGIIAYVLNNPVKAQLVENWDDWPWTYCKYR